MNIFANYIYKMDAQSSEVGVEITESVRACHFMGIQETFQLDCKICKGKVHIADWLVSNFVDELPLPHVRSQ